MDRDFFEQIERSRLMTPSERFRMTFELIDLTRSFQEAGIRRQNPDADEAEVGRILEHWRRIARIADEIS